MKKLITIISILILFLATQSFALNVVRLGPEYMPEPDRSGAIGNGYIYVGIPDLDPTVVANQKQITVQQEDGTLVEVSQPLRTNSGGVPVYQGSPVTLLVSGDYSILIQSSSTAQKYYVPSAQIGVGDVVLSLDEKYGCDMADAVSDIGSVTQTTLLVDCACVIASGTTVTSTDNISLDIKNGGSFDGVAGGGTETLNAEGNVTAGSYEVFKENLTVDKLKTVNVNWFGALPGDSVDDKASLQRASNAIEQYGSYYIPPGLYTVSGEVAFTTSDIEIFGAGDATIIQFDNSTDPYAIYGTRVGIFNLRGDNIVAHHFKLDQNFRNSGRVDGDTARIGNLFVGGFYASDSTTRTGVVIHDVTAYDYYGDAISAFNVQTDNIKIINNKCISTYEVQGWTTAGSGGEQGINLASGDVQLIEGNTIIAALDDAIAVHGFNDGLVINDNIITTTGGRILINGGRDTVVSGNQITYIQDGAYALFVSFEDAAVKREPDNTLIVGNIFKINTGVTVSGAIRVFGGGDTVSILDNQFYTEDTQGVAIAIDDRQWTAGDTLYYNVDGCVIKGNTFKNWSFGLTDSATSVDPVDVRASGNTFIDVTTAFNVEHACIGYNEYVNSNPTTTNRGYMDRFDLAALQFTELYIDSVSNFSSFVFASRVAAGITQIKNNNFADWVIGMTVEIPGNAPDSNLTINMFNSDESTNEISETILSGTNKLASYSFVPFERVVDDDTRVVRVIDSGGTNTTTIDLIIRIYWLPLGPVQY